MGTLVSKVAEPYTKAAMEGAAKGAASYATGKRVDYHLILILNKFGFYACIKASQDKMECKVLVCSFHVLRIKRNNFVLFFRYLSLLKKTV